MGKSATMQDVSHVTHLTNTLLYIQIGGHDNSSDANWTTFFNQGGGWSDQFRSTLLQ